MRNSLHIRFIINNKSRKDHKALLNCRLTYHQKRKVFSTGILVNSSDWYAKQQVLNDNTLDNEDNKTLLLLMKHELNQAFIELKVQKKEFDVNDIHSLFNGETTKEEKTLLEVFNLHNNRMKAVLGVEITKSTYSKFDYLKSHISKFLIKNYNQKDIKLIDLNMRFINELELYLKTERKQKQVTVNKYIQRFQKIIRLAIAEGYLLQNPFLLYKFKKVETRIVFLTKKELAKLETQEIKLPRLQIVRDLFVFCCYSGLAYQEMASLQKKDIIEGFDGNKWISMYRKKTNKEFSIPLLSKAQMMIDKYQTENKQEKLLPVISNQKINAYLKEIATIIKLEKRLTHHVARKTFATTVLLYNDVPMEIVSKVLGHSKISITQEYYGKIIQKKVSEHMNKLNDKLTSLE